MIDHRRGRRSGGQTRNQHQRRSHERNPLLAPRRSVHRLIVVVGIGNRRALVVGQPGLQRASAYESGASIAVEVWDVPVDAVGSFLALIPPPLGLGSLELADGRWVHGFICEAHALTAARDVTAFGGWRAFMQAGGVTAPL